MKHTWHPEERRASGWHRAAPESMPGRGRDPAIPHAELTLTKAEGSTLSGVLSSSHFNEEPVMVSVVKTSVFMRSIHNSHTWTDLQVQKHLVPSKCSGPH